MAHHPLAVGVPLRSDPASPRDGRRRGKNAGSVARTLAACSLPSDPGWRGAGSARPVCGFERTDCVAASQRLDEAAHEVAAVGDRAPLDDEHELVVVRHADLVRHGSRSAAARLRELDRLVVPVAAERRVHLAGDHRRHQVRADVHLVHPATPARRRGRGSSAGRRAGRRCRRRRPSCPRAGDTRVIFCLPTEMIEVSGCWTTRGHRDERQAAVAGQQHLRLVGDRRVDLARRRPAAAGWRGRSGPGRGGRSRPGRSRRRPAPGRCPTWSAFGTQSSISENGCALPAGVVRTSCFSPQPDSVRASGADEAPRAARRFTRDLPSVGGSTG